MFHYTRNVKSAVTILIFLSASWLSACESNSASAPQVEAPPPVQTTSPQESDAEESVASPTDMPAVNPTTEPASLPDPTSNPPEDQEQAQSGTEEVPTPEETSLQAASTTSLAFTTLNQGASMTLQLDKPSIFIAGTQDDIEALKTGLADPEITQFIETVDLNTNWVVGIIQGPIGSSGYGIEIQSVNQMPNEITMVADLTEPGPDQMTSDVITYPYHLIVIPKNELPENPGTSWSVYTGSNELLAQESYP
ncbi:MAG: protease complex subunit PrcB family protein [Anaerolineae bacterium]|nr:protease complex subunit PrcB family protein [Anaerolineae bacterium]